MKKQKAPAPAPPPAPQEPAPTPQPYVAEIVLRIPLGDRTPAQVEYLQRAASDVAAIFAKMLDPANLEGGDQ